MAYEIKDGQGSLFRNKKKTNERAPDMNGDVKLDGKMYRIAGWTRTTQTGDKWLSLSIQPKEDRPDASQPMAAEEDLPF